jgi:hypothetical protein
MSLKRNIAEYTSAIVTYVLLNLQSGVDYKESQGYNYQWPTDKDKPTLSK